MDYLHALSHWIENHQGLAAWIQAVFSVVAILYAGLVSRKQLKDARMQDAERRKYSEQQRINAVHALLHPILLVAQTIKPRFETNPSEAIVETWLDHFTDFKRALQSLPLFEIPDARLIVCLTTLMRAVDLFVDGCNEAKPLILRELERRKSNTIVYPLEDGGLRDFERKVGSYLSNLIFQANSTAERCQKCAFEKGFKLHQATLDN